MKKFSSLKFYFIIFSIVILGLIIDLILKQLTFEKQFSLISGVLSVFYTFNKGAGWSILANHTLFLTIFSAILVIGIICLIIFYKPKSKLFSVAIGLVLGGAIGNLVDRIFLGGVRDFICLDFITFPIFNFADMMLTVGAILLAIYLLFFLPQKDKKNETK